MMVRVDFAGFLEAWRRVLEAGYASCFSSSEAGSTVTLGAGFAVYGLILPTEGAGYTGAAAVGAFTGAFTGSAFTGFETGLAGGGTCFTGLSSI
jgi:hypothetical protein